MLGLSVPPGQGAIPLMGTSDPRAPELFNAIRVGRNLLGPEHDLYKLSFLYWRFYPAWPLNMAENENQSLN